MPELLLELFSEEIPARFQRRAAEDLKKAVTDAIVDAGLLYEGARAFVTPCADFDFIELSVNNAHACRFRVPVGHVARPSAGPRPPAGFCRVYVKVIGKFP